jgi:hypothetical protein
MEPAPSSPSIIGAAQPKPDWLKPAPKESSFIREVGSIPYRAGPMAGQPEKFHMLFILIQPSQSAPPHLRLYEGVPEVIVQEFLTAPSLGSYYNTQLKHNYQNYPITMSDAFLRANTGT